MDKIYYNMTVSPFTTSLAGRPCSWATVGLVTGCVNARSINNKADVLCRTIVDKDLDLLIITETWHEGSESAALKRSTLTGYKCVDAARSISADAAIHDVNFQNHGSLAIVYCDTIVFQKRNLHICISTFEYLCSYATTKLSQLLLFGEMRRQVVHTVSKLRCIWRLHNLILFYYEQSTNIVDQ